MGQLANGSKVKDPALPKSAMAAATVSRYTFVENKIASGSFF
jgi:hypothetical protein